MKLRPYQQHTIESLREKLRTGAKRIIMCAPTGAGKTVMFSNIIHRASERGTKCLILTDRVELFNQTLKAVGEHAQILNAKTKTHEFDPSVTVSIAMVETYKRRKLPEYTPELIILDEAHKAAFNKIMDKHPEAVVIGATATPEGKHLFKYYDDIVSSIDIPELVEAGFLSPCRAFQMQDTFEDLRVRAGEYTPESLFNHFDTKKLYDGVVDKWMEKASERKTIVFNVNIKHTEKTHEAFLSRGIRSAMLTSKTTKQDRERILSDFKTGRIRVLNNCGILTTGYDEPSITCVVVNRKTKSLPLWLQMCGRGSRIYPGKTNFLLLDFGQNHVEHGLWSQPRTWELKAPKKKKLQAAPVKECPKCYAMNYASATECMACQFVFPKKKKTHEEVNGVLVEVFPESALNKWVSELSVSELIQVQKTKRLKAAFIWRVMTHKSPAEREQYRIKMGYSKGWAWRQNKESNLPFKNKLLT